MPKTARRIWHDPVGSNAIGTVIGGIVLALLAAIWQFNWWPRILNYRIPLWIVILPIGVCFVVGFVVRLIWPHRKRIEILSLWPSDAVAFEQLIYGVTSDPNLPVELRVFAGNVWHRQWKLEFEGHNWRGRCRFGDDPGGSVGHRFQLVAIAPKTPLPDKIPVLPEDAVKSEIISVIRSSQ